MIPSVLRAAAFLGAVVLVVTGAAGPAVAQATTPSTPRDAAIARARGLVDAGDGATARALLDSLVRASAANQDDLVEALYWRAVLGETASASERDWKRLIIETPLSPRVPEALLRLAELDLLRGSPATARQHLDRLWRDHPSAPERPRALLWLARAWFDERELPRACGAVQALRADAGVPPGELRLQADELQARCRSVVAVPFDPAQIMGASSAGAAVTPPPAPAAPPTAAPTPAVSTRTAATGRWSVQLAAHARKADADAHVAQLGRRGITARIDADAQWFRVRVGRYATRAEAAEQLARLKAQGLDGFVVELTP